MPWISVAWAKEKSYPAKPSAAIYAHTWCPVSPYLKSQILLVCPYPPVKISPYWSYPKSLEEVTAYSNGQTFIQVYKDQEGSEKYDSTKKIQ